jgi:phage terminase large subunit
MKAAQIIRTWKHDPIRFVRDNFGIEPDAWQADGLMQSVAPGVTRRRIMLKACTGPGKSAELAWLGWHRLCCYAEPGEHPKGAALSGEGRDNLRDNLWSELSKWQARSKFLSAAFTWNQDRICAKDHPETWFLSARSYAKDADAEAVGRSLSGLHSRFPFVLLDETGDMPLTVGQKAEQIFTGGTKDGLIAGAGNPTSTTGLLYHVSNKARAQWVLITITADPDDPKRTSRVDVEHAREQIKIYGRDNPWVKATILGEFPESGFNNLISLDDVERSLGKHLRVDEYEFAQKRLGIDVSRFGDDLTVIFPRQGLAAFKPVVMRNARTNDIAARVMAAKAKWGSEVEMVDGSGGYGAGVIDSIIQAGHSPMEVYFSGKPNDPRFFNKRAEMWFEMAAWVKRGGALPNIPEMVSELTSPTYSFQNGKFRLEEKEQIKKRLGLSPDRGDALALTFALPEMPRRSMELERAGVRVGGLLAEFDPFKGM